MDELTIRKLYDFYGFSCRELFAPESGYRNTSYPASLSSGNLANLIVYKTEPKIVARIKLANKASDFLAANGLPARRTIDKRILRLESHQQTKFCSIYNYLPGNTIPWEAYSSEHLKLLGQNLAILHLKLQALPATGAPEVENELLSIMSWVNQYFESLGVKSAMAQKLGIAINSKKVGSYSQILKLCRNLPHRQLLHMDFVRSNILFSRQSGQLKISGILDFEKIAKGPKAIDIARTMAFLYVDCKYKLHPQIDKSFLVSGYIRRGGAPFSSYQLSYKGKRFYILQLLMEMFWLYDFYKFLKHNPYESLAENQHYARTVALLAERGVINSSLVKQA